MIGGVGRLTLTVRIRSSFLFSSLWKPLGLLLGLALVASACGSGGAESSGTEFGADVASPTTAAITQDPSDSDGGAVAQPETAQPETAQPDAGPVAPAPEHLFPDVDVVDIQTGATLNLASELAGGTQPVLLWFWAPH